MPQPEYESFRQAHREVVEESIQFRDQIGGCTEIGVADEAAFRACLARAYEGVEQDIRDVRALARERLDETGRRCRAALNSYLTVLDRYAAQLRAVRESASALRVDELTEGSKRLPGDQRRYIRFATNALLACAPA